MPEHPKPGPGQRITEYSAKQLIEQANKSAEEGHLDEVDQFTDELARRNGGQ